MSARTYQTGIHEHKNANLTKYSMMLGGLDVTAKSLQNYDPMRTGFYRVFMIRKPLFVDNAIPEKLNKLKHMIEYANTGFSGNDSITVNPVDIQGGFNTRRVELPSSLSDDTTEIVFKTYELSGSPLREVIQYWVTGVIDLNSGLSTYHKTGLPNDKNADIEVLQANHTAEFIIVNTDPSGTKVEFAALYANCFPKEIKLDHFNGETGTHEVVPYELKFTCTRYISPQINEKAKQLLTKYNVLMDSINFNSGYSDEDLYPDNDFGTKYDINTGEIVPKTSDEKGKMILT